jgi:hypothetical protein
MTSVAWRATGSVIHEIVDGRLRFVTTDANVLHKTNDESEYARDGTVNPFDEKTAAPYWSLHAKVEPHPSWTPRSSVVLRQ